MLLLSPFSLMPLRIRRAAHAFALMLRADITPCHADDAAAIFRLYFAAAMIFRFSMLPSPPRWFIDGMAEGNTRRYDAILYHADVFSPLAA